MAGLKTSKRLAMVALGMFGFGFALVPLYDVICDATGLNGRTSNLLRPRDAQAAAAVDLAREVTVEFMAIPNDVPWDFKPEVRKLRVHPGEPTEVSYTIKNRTDREVVAQAIPSVAPGSAARYFNKIECFCFTEQRLAAGEERRMPVVFVVDPALDRNVGTVTLSYTFFELNRPVKG